MAGLMPETYGLNAVATMNDRVRRRTILTVGPRLQRFICGVSLGAEVAPRNAAKTKKDPFKL